MCDNIVDRATSGRLKHLWGRRHEIHDAKAVRFDLHQHHDDHSRSVRQLRRWYESYLVSGDATSSPETDFLSGQVLENIV